MEIEALVDRIAQALGPAATPARVEAVAAAVLSLTGDSLAGDSLAGDSLTGDGSPHATPLPFHDGPGERVIISAFGHDQPGVLARVSTAVFEAGANILDVSQKILQGYFTLIMIADISNPRASMQALQDRLNRIADEFGVRVFVQHEDLFNAMHRP